MRPVLTMLVLVLLGGLVACAEEDHEAAYQKGKTAYEAGDYSTALELWTQASEAENTKAYNGLCIIFSEGLSVDQDLDAAELWCRKAISTKSAVATFNLGRLILQRSIKPNPFNAGRAAEGLMFVYLAKQRGSKEAVTFLDAVVANMPQQLLDVALEGAREEYPDEF